MTGARMMWRAVLFSVLATPHKPGEASFYVFNRVENDTIRWVFTKRLRSKNYSIATRRCSTSSILDSEPPRFEVRIYQDDAWVEPSRL